MAQPPFSQYRLGLDLNILKTSRLCRWTCCWLNFKCDLNFLLWRRTSKMDSRACASDFVWQRLLPIFGYQVTSWLKYFLPLRSLSVSFNNFQEKSVPIFLSLLSDEVTRLLYGFHQQNLEMYYIYSQILSYVNITRHWNIAFQIVIKMMIQLWAENWFLLHGATQNNFPHKNPAINAEEFMILTSSLKFHIERHQWPSPRVRKCR